MLRIRTAVITGVCVGLATYGADMLLIEGLHFQYPWGHRIAALVAGVVAFALAAAWKFTINIHAAMVEEKLGVTREVTTKIRDELNIITLVSTNNKRVDKAVNSIVNELNRLTFTHEMSATFNAMFVRWLWGERRIGNSRSDGLQVGPSIERRAPSRAAGERKNVD
jgi:hypothetical protein